MVADNALKNGYTNICYIDDNAKGDVIGTAEIAGGTCGNVALIADSDFSYALTEQESPEIILQGPGFVYAPIAKGQSAGQAYVCLGNKVIGEIPLFFGQTIECEPIPETSFWKKIFGGK